MFKPDKSTARISKAFFDLRSLDALARLDSSVHRLDPRAKLITTVVFIIVTVSFPKNRISALLPLFAYPFLLNAFSGIPFAPIFRKIAIAAPFAILIGIYNLISDKVVVFQVFGYAVTGGLVSFISIGLRFILTVWAVLVLTATTGFDSLCAGMAKLGVPRMFGFLPAFLYRYIYVLIDEGRRIARARSLRHFGGRGMELGVYTAMLGTLLLRSIRRAGRVHEAMLCRGFDGTFHLRKSFGIGRPEVVFMLFWTLFFISVRSFNLPLILGNLFTGFLK